MVCGYKMQQKIKYAVKQRHEVIFLSVTFTIYSIKQNAFHQRAPILPAKYNEIKTQELWVCSLMNAFLIFYFYFL